MAKAVFEKEKEDEEQKQFGSLKQIEAIKTPLIHKHIEAIITPLIHKHMRRANDNLG